MYNLTREYCDFGKNAVEEAFLARYDTASLAERFPNFRSNIICVQVSRCPVVWTIEDGFPPPKCQETHRGIHLGENS